MVAAGAAFAFAVGVGTAVAFEVAVGGRAVAADDTSYDRFGRYLVHIQPDAASCCRARCRYRCLEHSSYCG